MGAIVVPCLCQEVIMPITLQNFSCNFAGISTPQKHSKPQEKSILSPSPQSGFPSRAALVDKNYNQLLVKKHSNVNFKGNPGGFCFPLAKKVSSAVQRYEHGHIILVGKDLPQSQKLLKQSIESFDSVIKKVFFIQDDSIKGAVAFKKNSKGFTELVNLNKDNIKIVGDKPMKTYFAKKGDSLFLSEGDMVSIGDTSFKFSYEENNSLTMIRDLSVKEFDFSQQNKTLINNINKNHIEQLLPAQAKSLERKLTFKDVGGQDKAIEELKKSIIYPIKYPSAYKNQIINRGTILAGGPGTGKTLLAQALANETNAHYIQLNGLEMESKWVGESEKNWRNLFDQAKEHEPAVIFIDEFDAVARKRAGSETSRYDDKVVNQLLTLMSDAEKGKFGNVFVIVATNKLDLLDDAIVRSGRFGKHIQVEKPDLKGCKSILGIHSQNKTVSNLFNPDIFAEKLHKSQTSGADIAHIVNEANSNAFERSGIYKKMEEGTFQEADIETLKIEPEDFDKALDAFNLQNKNKQRNPIGFVNHNKDAA